jgi:hypothetical protein
VYIERLCMIREGCRRKELWPIWRYNGWTTKEHENLGQIVNFRQKIRTRYFRIRSLRALSTLKTTAPKLEPEISEPKFSNWYLVPHLDHRNTSSDPKLSLIFKSCFSKIHKVEVKLSLCLTKYHAMKTCWGSGGRAPRNLNLAKIFFKIHFIVNLSSTSVSSNWCLPFEPFQPKFCVYLQPPIKRVRGIKLPERGADPHLHLVPGLIMRGAQSPLPHVFVVCHLVKHRDNFT